MIVKDPIYLFNLSITHYMIFCTRCGNEISDEHEFCTQCGVSIELMNDKKLKDELRQNLLDAINKARNSKKPN